MQANNKPETEAEAVSLAVADSYMLHIYVATFCQYYIPQYRTIRYHNLFPFFSFFFSAVLDLGSVDALVPDDTKIVSM